MTGYGAKRGDANPDEVAEVEPIDVFHEEEVEAALVAEFVNRDDVGMVEGGEGFGLGLEAAREGFIGGEGLREELEGDEAVEGFLTAFVNGPHAASPDECNDFKIRESRGDLIECGSGGLVLARSGGSHDLSEETAGAETQIIERSLTSGAVFGRVFLGSFLTERERNVAGFFEKCEGWRNVEDF